MQELNHIELEAASGGIVINPVTAMIAVRVVQIASPYVSIAAYNATAAIASYAGYYFAQP